MKITGFDWDDGNWLKCGRHGVAHQEIEYILMHDPTVMPDPNPDDPRMRAIGKTEVGRYVFLVFALRKVGNHTKIRPISARYRHKKEIERYEKQR
jgi:uncharacterized DUF497 family protein